MADYSNRFTVFTKPWQSLSLEDLGKLVKAVGFDGVELAVRPGYQVEPDNVSKGLREAVKILGDQGVVISSIAGPTDEPTIAACGENGIPIIRICQGIDLKIGYLESEKKISSLLPVQGVERQAVHFWNRLLRLLAAWKNKTVRIFMSLPAPT